jgi:hypothetical protein
MFVHLRRPFSFLLKSFSKVIVSGFKIVDILLKGPRTSVEKQLDEHFDFVLQSQDAELLKTAISNWLTLNFISRDFEIKFHCEAHTNYFKNTSSIIPIINFNFIFDLKKSRLTLEEEKLFSNFVLKHAIPEIEKLILNTSEPELKTLLKRLNLLSFLSHDNIKFVMNRKSLKNIERYQENFKDTLTGREAFHQRVTQNKNFLMFKNRTTLSAHERMNILKTIPNKYENWFQNT